MFDHVGRGLDDHARQREAASAAFTLALAGGVVAAFAVVTAWTVVDELAAAAPDDFVVPYELAVEQPEEPMLAPPPPPPLARGSAEAEEPSTDEPDQPTDAIAELTPPEDTVRDVAGGDPDGEDGGDPHGEIGGVPWGTRNGQPGGKGRTGPGAGVVTLHHSEVAVKRRVMPDWPLSADALGLDGASCRATITVDATGRAELVQVEGCPDAFHPSTITALRRWRWEPAQVDGQPVRARFELVVRFQRTSP
jgi:protein TonB